MAYGSKYAQVDFSSPSVLQWTLTILCLLKSFKQHPNWELPVDYMKNMRHFQSAYLCSVQKVIEGNMKFNKSNSIITEKWPPVVQKGLVPLPVALHLCLKQAFVLCLSLFLLGFAIKTVQAWRYEEEFE